MKNKSKKSKPKVIKTNNKYKNIINDPNDSNLIKECNRAGISEINSGKNIEEELNIGEIFDVHIKICSTCLNDMACGTTVGYVQKHGHSLDIKIAYTR